MEKAGAAAKEIFGTLAIFFIIGMFGWLVAHIVTAWVFGAVVGGVATGITVVGGAARRSENRRAERQATVRARFMAQNAPARAALGEYPEGEY